MTTAQESTNGHRVPRPFSIETPDESNRADLPTNKTNNNPAPLQSQISDLPSPDAPPAFAANSYHVPPPRYAPKPHSYRYDDTLDLPPETSPLPERCQFMFSDGRQCTMARSEIHPSLCRFHSEREDQLFGDPVAGSKVVGAALDLPELYSACRDLTTTAGVSRALAQVFRLLAQRRISRQEAATFAKLAQLLLQSISAARTDPVSPPRKGYPPAAKVYQQDELSPLNDGALFAANKVVPSSGESHPPFRLADQELSPVNKVHHERGTSSALPPHDKVVPASDSHDAVPPSPIDAADVPQTWVMRSPVAVEQRMSPPNSQASRNEHFRKSDSQALQNQQIRKLET